MIRKSELKIRYDPEIGRYVKKHIYNGEIHGEGFTDIFKSIGSKLFGKTAKEMIKKTASTAATKTGQHLGNKAGDKIVSLLSTQNKGAIIPDEYDRVIQPQNKMTDFEIAQRVNQLISGGKIRKRQFYLI